MQLVTFKFRSPPIMGVDGPVFPSGAHKFGTVRIKGMSQEQINQPFMYPSNIFPQIKKT